jgi:hypothetical protein
MTNLDKNKELRSFTQESFDKSVADAAAKCDKEELISQYDPTITMAEIIDKYNALKERKARTILLTMSQFEFLLRKIEEDEWGGVANPHSSFNTP